MVHRKKYINFLYHWLHHQVSYSLLDLLITRQWKINCIGFHRIKSMFLININSQFHWLNLQVSYPLLGPLANRYSLHFVYTRCHYLHTYVLSKCYHLSTLSTISLNLFSSCCSLTYLETHSSLSSLSSANGACLWHSSWT